MNFKIGELYKCPGHELLVYGTYADVAALDAFLTKAIVFNKKNEIFMVLEKTEDRLGRLLVHVLFKDKKGWLIIANKKHYKALT